MNKLNKLFAILFAVLGVSTLSAQTTTDVTDLYLTNGDFEGNYSTFWSGDERAIFQPDGWTVVRTNGNDNDLSILCSTDVASGSFSGLTINDVTTRGNQTYWTRLRWGGWVWQQNAAPLNNPTDIQLQQNITLKNGVYRLSADIFNYAGGNEQNNHTYLKAVNDNYSLVVEPTIYNAKSDANWENKSLVITSSGDTEYTIILQSLQNWQNEHITGFDNVKLEEYAATSEEPVDITSIVGTSKDKWNGATGVYTAGGIGTIERYFDDQYRTGDMMTQTLKNLPLGLYEVELYANANWTENRGSIKTAAAAAGEEVSSVFANNISVPVPLAHQTTTATAGEYRLENVKVTDGNLTMGIRNDANGANWLLIQIKSLKYLGPDLSVYQEALSSAINTAKEFDQQTIPSDVASQLTAAITAGEGVEQTQEAIESATMNILSVIELANATSPVYLSINELITLCNTYAAESYSVVKEEGTRTTFTTAISTANTDKENATTVEALTNVYNTLESARQTYVTEAYPTVGNSFDMTYKILNAEVASKDNWTTNANLAENVQYNEAPDVFALDLWHWGAMDVYANQAINNLPNGVYTLTAMARTNGADMCYVYATNNEVEYKEVVPGDANWSLVTVSNIVVNKDASITLGLKGSINNTWFSVDNFKLYRAYDASVLPSLLEEANTIITDSEPMNAAVKEALTDAISSADIEATEPVELDNMVSNLSTAIANAKASIVDYALIRKYIDKAKVFDADDVELAEMETKYTKGEFTAAEPVRQALNVWTANYVATNFKNEILLTEWSAESNAMWSTSGEHWDGTTGEGCTTYYDANGTNTTHTLSKTVDLIPGTYVFRGAGRSNTNTKLSLSIDIDGIDPVVFNAKGNTGYGIATDGTATFDPEAQYARNDEGQGWEWEFIKFTLTENTTVTLTATCKTTGWGWASFANNGLWMDDATYVTVYGKELDALMAEAKALVNTKPMGTAENTALANAIALGSGTISTPAELNAAVDALKSAVANANAWLAAYNEAKAPLVAALERFETDYNDAENGALDHMNKSRWATAIEKAQAAAEAKDATDSYAGFADATAALVAALDAATVSVNEYASLKSAITEATVVSESEVNWGDAPFQRPESAQEGLNTAISAAESGYDAAEADGEEVTALIDAMAVTLNAPQDAYCITVATDGHAYAGCPVVASLGSITDNNPTGYGFAAKKENEDLLAQLYTFTQVDGNKYRISVMVEGKTVYLTYGVLNDSQAGYRNGQIQGNTDIAKAGEFEVVASTTTEGVFRLRNTVTGTFLDCQDGGAIYTDDNITKDEFALASATVSTAINISADAKLGTCVLMFDAQLPDGLTAYVPESYDNGTTVLTLKMVTGGVLPAYTPCLLYAEGGYEGTLTGTVTMNGYAGKVTGDDGLLYGAIESQIITEGYILQKHDGEEVAKFYSVDGLEEEIPISAGKCWLTLANGVEEALETPAAVAFFFRGGGATKLNAVVMDKTTLDGAIYTLDGKRVNTMQRGEIYIINGQKVMVK